MKEFSNTKLYWIIKEKYNDAVYEIQLFKYVVSRNLDEKAEYWFSKEKSIGLLIKGLIKSLIFALVVWLADIVQVHFWNVFPEVDSNMFNSLIICGIGMAVVVLGLYCSNIASIYSVSYKNAPKELANQFYEDKFTSRSVSSLIEYTFFGLVLLCRAYFTDVLYWISVFVYSIWSAYVVCVFAASRNRVYQLADVYSLAGASHGELLKISTKYIIDHSFMSDIKFQLWFRENALKQLNNLRTIQRYASTREVGTNLDHSSIDKFMLDNLKIIKEYWVKKNNINMDSEWYRVGKEYSKWHSVSGTEAFISLGTGFLLKKTGKTDYWWLENEIFDINIECLKELLGQRAYDSILQYMDSVKGLFDTAFLSNETESYLKHLKQIGQIFEKIIDDTINGKVVAELSEAFEKLGLLYLNILESGIEMQSCYDADSTIINARKAIDSSKDLMKEADVISRRNNSFYQCLRNEYIIEGRRITPDWVINNEIALKEYENINTLVRTVCDANRNEFNLGRKCKDNDMLLEACLILVRYFQYEKKICQFLDLIKTHQEAIRRYKCESDDRWNNSPLEELEIEYKKNKEKVPGLLSECTEEFAIKNWGKLNQYPDFLGECFYEMCENAVGALTENNIKQFGLDYDNLSRLMCIYRNYIHDNTGDSRVSGTSLEINAVAVPMMEWAFVGGLAIVWGAFENNINWSKTVRRCTDDYWEKGMGSANAEMLIDCIRHQDFKFSSKDMIEFNWKMVVEASIRRRQMYDTEVDCYGHRIKTQVKWLNEFCPRFDDWGISSNPSEVFLITCINPHLKSDKQFCSNESWGTLLNDYLQFEN
ncbi:MAG: hypothetical protein J6X94_05830 [Lachnospiraceae bacterium]|nr:hypothetical protein [Lachnospiraceae bacterium]